MSFTNYQELASNTIDRSKGAHELLVNYAMGLAGESGETVDYLKKVLFHGHDLEAEKVASELGDVLWYISGICTVLNISLEEVALYNIEKLSKRYPDGFSQEASINREENKEVSE
jgi:NTP pyrophosphatase (non-canonical NTP hydrolase)